MKKLSLCFLSAALALAAFAADEPARKVHGRTPASETRAVTLDRNTVHLIKGGPARRHAQTPDMLRTASDRSELSAISHAPAKAPGDVPEIQGFVIGMDAWFSGDRNIGLYKLPTTGSGHAELVYSIEQSLPDEAEIYTYLEVDGKVYAPCVVSDLWGIEQTFSMLVFDASTGELLSNTPSSKNEYIINAAIDPVTGTVYAVTGNPYPDYYTNETYYKYGTMSFEGGEPAFTPIKSWDYYPKAMVFDKLSDLYMLLPASSYGSQEDAAMVVRLDPNTGSFEQIGALPVKAEYRSGAVVDPASGRCFWNASGLYTTSLYEVDLPHATASKLFDYADGISAVGLKIAAPAAVGTPGRVENLTLSFPEASLSGQVSFDVPAVEGTDKVQFIVKVDDVEVGRKECAAPSHVDYDYTADAPGLHMFNVSLVNGELSGPAANASMFLGYGKPNAPEVSASWLDGTMTVSWNEVNTTSDGGYINPADVRYTVICANDESVLAENIAETTLSFAVPVPETLTRYKYIVVAKYRDNSVRGTSNDVTVGYLPIPYVNSFDSAADFEELSVIDANNDGKTWKFNNGFARYSYNSSKPADDWLMTPPVRFEKGKAYRVSFKARSNSASYAERLEVKYGTSSAIEAMTGTILEPTILPTIWENGTYSVVIMPENTTPFILGFHAISDKDMMYLDIDDIVIEAGPSLVTPSAPTDIAVTPDADGDFKVSISVKAPVNDISGAPLTENVDLYISRGNEVIKEVNVAPGATVNAEDVLSTDGNVTYSFYAANASGASESVSVTVFVGIKEPIAPAGITMTENGNTGFVTISWQAVDTDIDGGSINPAKVKYNVYGFNSQNQLTLLQGGISGTSYSLQAVDPSTQDFVQYALSAETSGGEGELVPTPSIAAGKPYEEMTESFADGRLAHVFLIRTLNLDMSWSLKNDNGVEGIVSADGDNGYAASNAKTVDAAGALESGKLIVPDIENPALTFHTFNITDSEGSIDENLVQIQVAEVGSDEFTTIFSRSVNDICDGQPGWGKAMASLVAYKGKTIRFRIVTVVKQFTWTTIDNINIETMRGHDLRVADISAPESVQTGREFSVDAAIINDGANFAENYTVELYADDELVATKDCSAHSSSTSKTVSFPVQMHQLAEQAISYHVSVVYGLDENPDNNVSAKVIVAPRHSALPAVTDLRAKAVAEGAELSWSEPNLEGGVCELVTEDLEGAESWAHSIEGWTFIDADQTAVGGFKNMTIPGITVGETKASFFVFNGTETGNATFSAHSGDKYLAALFRSDDGQTDDWAISPLLSGNAQKIAFYARSYSSQYPEEIEVLASSTGIDIADFTVVRQKTVVPANWQRVEVDLPAGTIYFAIRSLARGSFMLLVDDITFEKAYSTMDLGIVGYNVWRNGEKLNAEPVEETTFTDSNAPEGDHSYVVTTIYTAGESRGSNLARISLSGIENIAGEGISISADKQTIVVRGARGRLITVNAVDGRTVSSVEGQAVTRIPVGSGIYVVTVDSKVAKIIVR